MKFLLDTNAWISYLRRNHAGLIHRLQQADPSEICLCSVVLAELIFGAYRSPRSAFNLGLLIQIQSQFLSLPFDDKAAEEYGKIQADLTARGQLIGPNDMLIAAIALANDLTLVTHNTAEFSRVTGLKLDDWQTP